MCFNICSLHFNFEKLSSDVIYLLSLARDLHLCNEALLFHWHVLLFTGFGL